MDSSRRARSPSRAARTIAVALAALAGTALMAAHAVGHGSVTSASPAPGAVLAAAPPAVTATYNEPVIAVREARVSIDGRETPVTAAVSAGNRLRVVVPLPSRGPGAYRVSWVVVSADGHAVAGETAFRVRPAPVAAILLRTSSRVRAVARSVEAAVVG